MTNNICETLDAKKAELAAAESELDSWYEYDARRPDGSGAQDRRHEERGESLCRRVSALTQEVSQLQKQLG